MACSHLSPAHNCGVRVVLENVFERIMVGRSDISETAMSGQGHALCFLPIRRETEVDEGKARPSR